MKAFKSSAVRRGFLKGASFAAALASIASLHADSIVNGDFESGLSGWTESGGSGLFSAPESITGFYDSIIPPSSGHLGLVSNNGVESSSISQTFTVTLTVNGSPATLLSIARNDLQAGGEGSLLAGAGYIDNTQHGYDIGVSHLAVDNVRTSAIPEPSIYAILTVAGLLFLFRRRRFRA